MSKRLIGLTGGIGTGKSAVSRYLADKYQLPILDADIYAKEAVTPNSPIWRQIVNRYGTTIQLPDGGLNRKVLGEIIFNNPTEKSWLEGKIHPYVRERFLSEGQQLKADTVVLVIPLLFEAQMTDLVTEIWVVSCSDKQQLERLIERDRLTPEQARARIQSQLLLSTKIAGADLILDNSSTLEHLQFQIDTALKL
ncbi:MAG: dephospho-CoA kinase [Prochloron sp. SP5CPC1]|nr:dephospho-CoA kinase [Candidatus Paraprochloron terpiosi SP5CPC1]